MVPLRVIEDFFFFLWLERYNLCHMTKTVTRLFPWQFFVDTLDPQSLTKAWTQQNYARAGQLRCNIGTIATRPGVKNRADVRLWCVLSLLHSVAPHFNPLTDQMMTVIFWYEMISMHYKPSHPGPVCPRRWHNCRLIQNCPFLTPSVRRSLVRPTGGMLAQNILYGQI